MLTNKNNFVKIQWHVNIYLSYFYFIILRLSTIHDTALWPSDFAAVSNFEIEFKPGEPQTKQLALNIKNDTVVEETERFYVVLTNADNHVSIGNWNRTTILIEDDDGVYSIAPL